MKLQCRRRVSPAFTLLESAIAVTLTFVVVGGAWSLLSSGLKGNRLVSYLASLKGARILRESLRRDLASLDVALGYKALEPSEEGLVISVVRPANGNPTPSSPPLLQGAVRYEFQKTPGGLLRVVREGAPLRGVLLEGLEMRLLRWHHLYWLQVQIVAVDPGLARAGVDDLERARACKLPRHETGFILPLPANTTDPSFVAYDTWPPELETGS